MTIFDFTSICYSGCLTSTTLSTFSAPTTLFAHYNGHTNTTSILVSGPSSRYSSLGATHPRRQCQRHFSNLGIPLNKVFETFQAMGFLALLASRPLSDLVSSQLRLYLYYVYHQSIGHHTDRYTAVQHAIHDIVVFRGFCHPRSNMIYINSNHACRHPFSSSP